MKSVNGGGAGYCPLVHTIYSDNFNIVIVIITSICALSRGQAYILHFVYAKKFFLQGCLYCIICISDFLYVRGILHYIVFAVYVAVILYSLYVRRLFCICLYLRPNLQTYRNLIAQLIDSAIYGFTFSLKENPLTCIFQLSQGL